MAQQVNCLLCKHECLNSNPQTHRRAGHCLGSLYSQCCRDQRCVDPGILRAGRPASPKHGVLGSVKRQFTKTQKGERQGEASSCQRLSSTHGQMGLCTHAHSFLTQNQTQRKMKHDGNWEINKDAMIKVYALETMKTVYCFRQNKTRVSKKIKGTT